MTKHTHTQKNIYNLKKYKQIAHHKPKSGSELEMEMATSLTPHYIKERGHREKETVNHRGQEGD